MKATIQNISHAVRSFQGRNGETKVIEGFFTDGAKFTIFCNPDKVEEYLEQLTAVKGQEAEFEVKETKNTEQYGTEHRLASWPGKPQRPAGGGFRGGGGGGREWKEAYRNTEQGAYEERRSIARSVALQQAVCYVNAHQEEGAKLDPGRWTLTLADMWYEWLVKEMHQPAQRTPEDVKQEISGENKPLPPAAPPRSFKKPPCPKCGELDSVMPKKGKPGEFSCWKSKGGCEHSWKDLGELAAQVGVPPGTQTDSIQEAVEKEIDKAVKAKDLARIRLLEERVCQRLNENALSVDEAARIDDRFQQARRAIDSGMSFDRWMETKVSEAQERLQQQHDAELGMPPEDQVPF